VTEREKECMCHTCDKPLHSLGVARHRAMHMTRREKCVIETSDGTVRSYNFEEKAK